MSQLGKSLCALVQSIYLCSELFIFCLKSLRFQCFIQSQINQLFSSYNSLFLILFRL